MLWNLSEKYRQNFVELILATEENFKILKFFLISFLILPVALSLIFTFFKLENNILGLIWITGSTGNPDEEYLNPNKCEITLKINFVNPVLLINKILPKMKTGKKSFVAVLTSVAGLRGRSKRLFYSSAKAGLIAYLSALRQKFNQKNRFKKTK